MPTFWLKGISPFQTSKNNVWMSGPGHLYLATLAQMFEITPSYNQTCTYPLISLGFDSGNHIYLSILPTICSSQVHKHILHKLIVHHVFKFSFLLWIPLSPIVSYLYYIFHNRAAHALKILIDQPWFEEVLLRLGTELSRSQIKDRAGKCSGSGTTMLKSAFILICSDTISAMQPVAKADLKSKESLAVGLFPKA